MKRFAIILGVIGISCSHPKTTLDNLSVNGAVIKLTEDHFKVEEISGKYQPGEKQNWNTVQMFNEAGHIVRTEFFDREGDLDGTEKFTYDNNSFLIGQTSLNSNKKILYTYKYENNQDGNPSKITRYNDSNLVTSTTTLKYSGGNVEFAENWQKDIKQSWANEFDGSKIVKQVSFDSAENKINTVNWEYNDYGFVIKYFSYDKNDSLTYSETYDYPKYDLKKNWIERITFEAGKPTGLTIRRILYMEDTFIDSKSIIGIWRETKRNTWIEFKDDGKYHSGYDENIRDMGKWDLDNKNKTLTFESNEPANSKKYTFIFDGEYLIFQTLDGEEEKRFQRR